MYEMYIVWAVFVLFKPVRSGLRCFRGRFGRRLRHGEVDVRDDLAGGESLLQRAHHIGGESRISGDVQRAKLRERAERRKGVQVVIAEIELLERAMEGYTLPWKTYSYQGCRPIVTAVYNTK